MLGMTMVTQQIQGPIPRSAAQQVIVLVGWLPHIWKGDIHAVTVTLFMPTSEGPMLRWGL